MQKETDQERKEKKNILLLYIYGKIIRKRSLFSDMCDLSWFQSTDQIDIFVYIGEDLKK